jgi:hypothetical protein
MEPVKVSMKAFTEDVNNGATRKELMAKYGLSVASVKQIAKRLGLEIKRDMKPKFELVEDVVSTNQITLDQAIAEATPCVNHDLQQETVSSLNA